MTETGAGVAVRPRAALRALLAALLLALAVPVAGQGTGEAARPPASIRDPGGHPFRAPAASPLEPLPRLTVAHVSRDTAAGAVAMPDIGAHLPFWLRRDPSGPWELAGTVAAGVFSRFDLERSDNELIEVHYRVGLQLRTRYRAVAARLELYHVSSHLGDEFLTRTGRAPISTSREAVELLLQGSPLPGLTLYGGPGAAIRSTEGLDPLSLRGGLEWAAPRLAGGVLGPYLAADASSLEELGWDPTVALEGGLELGSRARVAFTVGRGPSRAEQFYREDETVVGAALAFRR